MIGELDFIKTAGQLAGIAGVCVGAFTLIFRDIVRKKIFPSLGAADAYKLLRLIIVCSWTVAIAGMGAWVYSGRTQAIAPQTENILGIAGTVIDASTNSSVAQATVSLVGLDTTTLTDDNGNFSLSVKQEKQEALGGHLRLRVSRDGYRTSDVTIVAPTQQLIIQLHK